MYIYKIINLLNDRVYIGQVYNKTIYDRFKRHIHDAKNTSKSYIDRSIAKYGSENFKVEEIDTAETLDELNYKEKYWINFYNSTDHNYGYNLTPGGDGGNTYLCKTEDEMNFIKSKISAANTGENNGMAKGVKCRNEITGEEYYFPTLAATLKFFNLKNKGNITSRCNKRISCLYKNIWNFAWGGEDYTQLNVHDPSAKRGIAIKITDLDTGVEWIFTSINKLCKYLDHKKLTLSRLQELYKNKYKIEIFN